MKKCLYQMQTFSAPVALYDVTDTPYPPKSTFLSYVVARKSTFDIIGQMEVSQPAAILYTEPLLSMPARWDFTATETGRREMLLRRVEAAIRSQEVEFANIVVLTAAVDETPVFVGKLLEGVWNWEFQKKYKEALTASALKAMEPDALLANNAAGYTNPSTTYPVTVLYLLTEIRRHMLEVNDGVEDWQLWQPLEVVHYLRERIARFLVETGVVQDVDTLTSVVGQASYDLPTTVAELKRVAYDGVGLYPVDFWQTDNTNMWSAANATPYGYLENVEQLSVQLSPPPAVAGDPITVHSVKSTPFTVGAVTGDSGELTALQLIMTYYLRLPAIFAWAVKYGVMADMLKKEGEANDPQRAEWCEQRFKDGVELGKLLVGYPLPGSKG